LVKRLSQKQKDEIINQFSIGISIEELSIKYGCTKLTISRNLKKFLGEDRFEKLKKKESSILSRAEIISDQALNKRNLPEDQGIVDQLISPEVTVNLTNPEFIELTPLDYEIDNSIQKDISSIPLSKVDFPKEVFMIVNKNIELEIKVLRDYPDWHFLPDDDLNRKTIEIFNDLKVAKRDCRKEQKVLKVPNTNVFKITARILISKGITRIVNDDKLISL
tara:strand:- start:575 stop:1234 length:660 start_codon:yes stop_codon:yes gene_type:complete